MPGHRAHRLIDRVLLGKDYPKVHRHLDRPAKWLGARHRVRRHQSWYPLARYGFTGEALAGMLHLLADKVDTERKRRWRR